MRLAILLLVSAAVETVFQEWWIAGVTFVTVIEHLYFLKRGA